MELPVHRGKRPALHTAASYHNICNMITDNHIIATGQMTNVATLRMRNYSSAIHSPQAHKSISVKVKALSLSRRELGSFFQ